MSSLASTARDAPVGTGASAAGASAAGVGDAGAGAAGHTIAFERVSVAYRGSVVLDSLELTVEPGEIVALIGPSGSGKTTALRAVAGFVRPSAGRIRIGGRDVTDLPPYARDIGMVVQNYALFPHMRVADNVAFGLAARRTPRDVMTTRVDEALRIVGMAGFKTRFPRELSGGQQQRVAIARALAIQPRVLLLDEPLSALDAQIRRSMVEELARLHRAFPSLTVLYVTHDQVEALTLADRIAILRDGRLAACGTSRGLYARPPNRFAAEFLGRANLLPVRLEGRDGAAGLAQLRFGATRLTASAPAELAPGRSLLLCIRPHDVRPGVAGDVNAIAGRVEFTQWQGDVHNILLRAEDTELRLSCVPMNDPPAAGDWLTVTFPPERATLVPDDPAAP